jgi:excisionase family DNA binding protein
MSDMAIPLAPAPTDNAPTMNGTTCKDCCRSLFSAYPEVMSIGQVSEALGVCPNSVRKLIYEHELPAKKVNYKWRVLRQDLRDWMLAE